MASRRLPPIAVAAATVLAVLAAGLVLVVLRDDGSTDTPADDAAAGSGYELTPAGDLPASVEEVRLVALDGGDDQRLGDMLGEKPAVVNFFASWCAPCIQEMPDFETVHQAVGDEVTILGMGVDRAPEAARDIVERTGVTYPTFGDPQSSAMTYFGGIQMPTTVFIDAGGEVVDMHAGTLTDTELRKKIDDLFGVAA